MVKDGDDINTVKKATSDSLLSTLVKGFNICFFVFMYIVLQ